jgi:hypothetical protein
MPGRACNRTPDAASDCARVVHPANTPAMAAEKDRLVKGIMFLTGERAEGFVIQVWQAAEKSNLAADERRWTPIRQNANSLFSIGVYLRSSAASYVLAFFRSLSAPQSLEILHDLVFVRSRGGDQLLHLRPSHAKCLQVGLRRLGMGRDINADRRAMPRDSDRRLRFQIAG